jgi:5-enolpyruvylshikimate-3-phosphate synthase
MAFTVASMLTEKSNVTGAESVDVSYPNFLEDMTKLYASIRPS